MSTECPRQDITLSLSCEFYMQSVENNGTSDGRDYLNESSVCVRHVNDMSDMSTFPYWLDRVHRGVNKWSAEQAKKLNECCWMWWWNSLSNSLQCFFLDKRSRWGDPEKIAGSKKSAQSNERDFTQHGSTESTKLRTDRSLTLSSITQSAPIGWQWVFVPNCPTYRLTRRRYL